MKAIVWLGLAYKIGVWCLQMGEGRRKESVVAPREGEGSNVERGCRGRRES